MHAVIAVLVWLFIVPVFIILPLLVLLWPFMKRPINWYFRQLDRLEKVFDK